MQFPVLDESTWVIQAVESARGKCNDIPTVSASVLAPVEQKRLDSVVHCQYSSIGKDCRGTSFVAMQSTVLLLDGGLLPGVTPS